MSLLIKPSDPLFKSGPDQQRALFLKMAEASRGHGIDEVIGAAMNVIVNALRQTYPSLPKALEAADQKSAKLKELLAANYTSNGRLNGVFPFNQNINVDHFIDKETIRG